MSDRKAVIKNADMNEEMQQDAVDFATQALEKFNIEKVRHSIKTIQILPPFHGLLACKDMLCYIDICLVYWRQRSANGWMDGR